MGHHLCRGQQACVFLDEFGVVVVAVGEDDILDIHPELTRCGKGLARRISAVDYRTLEAFFVIDEIGIRAEQTLGKYFIHIHTPLFYNDFTTQITKCQTFD